MSDPKEAPALKVAFRVGIYLYLTVVSILLISFLQMLTVAGSTYCWPTVQGKLTHAVRRASGVKHHVDDVSYVYTVSGKTYVGDRVRWNQKRSDNREGVGVPIKDLRPGQQVDVSYDPADPSRSVLYPGWAFFEFWMCFMTCFFTGIWVNAVRLLWARRRPATSSACNP